MAISPITIATQGFLNSPLAVAAVRGRLFIELSVPSGTSTGGAVARRRLLMPDERLDRQLKREDEEVVAIIIAFMEVMDE